MKARDKARQAGKKKKNQGARVELANQELVLRRVCQDCIARFSLNRLVLSLKIPFSDRCVMNPLTT